MGWRERRANEYVQENYRGFRNVSKVFGKKPKTREEIYNRHLELLKLYPTENDYEIYFVQKRGKKK